MNSEWRPGDDLLQRIGVYSVLVFVCGVTILPFYWMVVTSLRGAKAIYQFPPRIFLHRAHPANYLDALHATPFFQYLGNSMWVAAFAVVGQTACAVIVGYSFAKIDWRGRRLVFSVLLATLFMPGAVTLAPTYIIFHQIGWTGTYLPLIVPPFFGGAFNIFMVRQFYRSIPQSIVEAAQIDGASHWGILWRFVVPLSKPAIAAVALFSFVASWDDFLTPLIYLTNPNMNTLPLGLYNFMNSHGTVWNQLMAASVMFMIPMLLVFFFGQRVFLNGGLQTTGIKG